MKEKINIADILKDKPKGLNLYSPVYGKVKFEAVHKDKIYFYHDMNEHSVKSNGKSFDDGEVVIFPSQKMRDWSKFAWKKGDILVNKDAKVHIIFDGFDDDTYKNFHGQYYLWEEGGSIVSFEEDENYMQTSDFNKANKEDAQEYIHKIEKELGGKLNMETLKIEKAQPEFKDGDIVALDTRYIDSDEVIVESFIVRGDYKYGDDLKFYAACSNNKETDVVYNSSIMINKTSVRKESLRLSTEEEKQQLFEALAKEGKVWNTEKKEVVDIKKELQFKPFEKVLVRDSIDDVWRASFFSHIKENDGRYVTTCVTWKFCIPYIGNESLLGTTKDVEG